MSLTKKLQPQPKNCCSLQTTRLAKSLEPLNSSLPLSVPELYSRKATCNPVVLVRNPRNLPAAKKSRTQKHRNAEKSRLQDLKRAGFIWYWQRSGLKNPDKLKIFIKKNIRNHSYHQFYLILVKICINRGSLYINLEYNIMKIYVSK